MISVSLLETLLKCKPKVTHDGKLRIKDIAAEFNAENAERTKPLQPEVISRELSKAGFKRCRIGGDGRGDRCLQWDSQLIQALLKTMNSNGNLNRHRQRQTHF